MTSYDIVSNTANIKRLNPATYAVFAAKYDNIIPYGIDNLYPNVIFDIIKQSPSLSTATQKKADFIIGNGFENEKHNDIEVNEDGQTLFDILRLIAYDYCALGFNLHVNYNVFGQVSEITFLNFEQTRRKNKDEFVVKESWQIPSYGINIDNTAYHYLKFDPAKFRDEIKNNGTENAKGQIFYFSTDGQFYPTAFALSVLDRAQFESEAGIYGLSCIQNGFPLEGIMQVPKSAAESDDFKKFIKSIKENRGAENAGKIAVVGVPADSSISNLFQPITSNDADSKFVNQSKDAADKIFSVFSQQSILNGRPESGMFNQDQIIEATDYYNDMTELDRKIVEKQLNKIWKNSVWFDGTALKIKAKKYKEKKESDGKIDND